MSSRVDTAAVAKNLDSVKFDRLPSLIVDDCLSDCAQEVGATADMVLNGKVLLPHETLAMPKKRSGPRPVTVTSTAARVAYLALVEHLGDSLGPKSRVDGRWKEYQSFALGSESEYIARFDIASFYEYIDHQLLTREVLSRTLDPAVVTKLENVLTSVSGGTRGLPQLLTSSDHLADAYIGVLERRLIRDGYSVARYVDDFTVACSDWETANVVIERAAEYARSLGLVLSSEKTVIAKRTTVVATEQSQEKFIRDKFQAVKIEEAQIFLWGPYDNEVAEIDGISDEDAMMAVMWSLVGDWMELVRSSEPEEFHHREGHYRTYLPPALAWLRGHQQRIPDDVLQEIVFRHPLFLASVCGYLLARIEKFGPFEDPWPSIRQLAVMGRQSPWAKLWLLDTVARTQVNATSSTEYASVMEWVDRQLLDRHEVVRAQAAWVAASHGRLRERALAELYTRASLISQPALAACMAKQGDISKGVVGAIKQDDPMMKKAYSWAEKQTSTN
ncbi:hypothetical protein SVIOM342S_06185 [Streptomyces violaceorubidus]